MYVWIVQGPKQKKMRKGKACGQTGHAFARLARLMSLEEWDEYTQYEVKIVYKVSTPKKLVELFYDFKNDGYRATLVYDDTWEKYTCFGIVTKDDPNPDGRFKLA